MHAVESQVRHSRARGKEEEESFGGTKQARREPFGGRGDTNTAKAKAKNEPRPNKNRAKKRERVLERDGECGK